MKQSAGILIYRFEKKQLQVLLVHPGGPFWKNKDEGAWSIPKGEFTDEAPLAAALRECREELGIEPEGELLALEPVRQRSGKTVHAWALESAVDSGAVRSNHFEMEWPPRSGKMQSFPEIDKAAWFSIAEAGRKINSGQSALLEQLQRITGKH